MEYHTHVIWPRAETHGMTHPEILDAMVAEARAKGYEPVDLQIDGTPNIYLRGRYLLPSHGRHRATWIEDIYLMYVRKVKVKT